MAQFSGSVVAEICEARFAFSGKVASVKKRSGDSVERGEVIATLDRAILQAELERQLADYEKVRAEFDTYTKKSSDSTDDASKFARQARQALLNASVKDVELAKYRVDQADLLSPVDGTIQNLEGLSVGQYIAPSSSAVKIISTHTLQFIFEVNQGDLRGFLSPVKIKIRLHGIDKEYYGMTRKPVSGVNGTFPIAVDLEEISDLIPGLQGEVFT